MQINARFNCSTPLTILIVTTLSFAFFYFFPPIEQEPSYHLFADRRTTLGIPHFMNVLSGFIFFLIGVWGLRVTSHAAIKTSFERTVWRFFFYSSFLVAIGAMYYHAYPTTATLFWDRIAMAPMFALFLSILIAERISVLVSKRMTFLLIAAALASVFYWIWTEKAGHGDLRFYAWFQLLIIFGVPLLFMLYHSPYTGEGWWLLGYLLLLVSKICELLDVSLFAITHQIISGHTLKHLTSGGAIACLILALKLREIK